VAAAAGNESNRLEQASESAHDARLGTLLRGKYRLDKLLGVGGMAAVYAATHRNGSRVAIKILHTWLSRDAVVRPRFVREGYVANAVNHHGVVRVVDDEIAEDGSAFLVMELLEGETVAQRAGRSGGRMAQAEVAAIATKALDVLAAAHAKGIVHRDIKPDNLFLTRDGQLKVLDFGVARIKSDSVAATRSGVLMGTPGFMPPEQVLGHRHKIDGQSDVWAVGATIYCLLTGGAIHDAESPEELWFLTATTPVPPIRDRAENVDPALARIVDVALRMDKDERWSSARSMQHALREVIGKARLARCPEGARTSDVPARRHATLAPAPTTVAASSPNATTKRPRIGRLAAGAAVVVAIVAGGARAARSPHPTSAAAPLLERHEPENMRDLVSSTQPTAPRPSLPLTALPPVASPAPSLSPTRKPAVRPPTRRVPKARPEPSASSEAPRTPEAERDVFDEP
jgi:serine/threonine-protein kinase